MVMLILAKAGSNLSIRVRRGCDLRFKARTISAETAHPCGVEYRSVTLERWTPLCIMGERAVSCVTICIQRVTSIVLLRHILVASKRAPTVHIYIGTKESRIYSKGLQKNSFLRLISMLEFC